MMTLVLRILSQTQEIKIGQSVEFPSKGHPVHMRVTFVDKEAEIVIKPGRCCDASVELDGSRYEFAIEF